MKGTYHISEEDTAEYYGREIKNVSKTTSGNRIYGRVYVPESWIGKRVMCLLLDEIDNESSKI